MTIFGLAQLFTIDDDGKNAFLIPDKKWSDVTSKVFDVEEPDA